MKSQPNCDYASNDDVQTPPALATLRIPKVESCKVCGTKFPPLPDDLPDDLFAVLGEVDTCGKCLDDYFRGLSMKPRHVKKRIKARAKWAAKIAARK